VACSKQRGAFPHIISNSVVSGWHALLVPTVCAVALEKWSGLHQLVWWLSDLVERCVPTTSWRTVVLPA